MLEIKDAKERLQQITKKAELLKVLSHPVRLCIIRGLMNDPGCNVSKIMGCLDLPQSTVSQHLARLKAAEIVRGERSGLEVNYYVINEDAKKIVDCIID